MTHTDAIATTGCKTAGEVIDRPSGDIAALWRAYAGVLERERVAQKTARKKTKK
jgi:hypothetical protein